LPSLKQKRKKTPCKNWLISTLDKVIYLKGTFFQGSTKPLFTSQNRVETGDKLKKIFSSNMLLLCSVDLRISMIHLHTLHLGESKSAQFEEDEFGYAIIEDDKSLPTPSKGD
jgi:hypothetical protein